MRFLTSWTGLSHSRTSISDWENTWNFNQHSNPYTMSCAILRSRVDFAAATSRCPLNIATEAMRHQCSAQDDDAVTFEKPAQGARKSSSYQRRRGNRTYQATRTPATGGTKNKIKNCCYFFQDNTCSRQQCAYRHICDSCGSVDHGSRRCPNDNDPSSGT